MTCVRSRPAESAERSADTGSLDVVPASVSGVVRGTIASVGEGTVSDVAPDGRTAGIVGSGAFHAETVCSMRADRAELPGRFNEVR